MGCPNYPILETTITAVVGKDISLVNPAKETANEMKKYRIMSTTHDNSIYILIY